MESGHFQAYNSKNLSRKLMLKLTEPRQDGHRVDNYESVVFVQLRWDQWGKVSTIQV